MAAAKKESTGTKKKQGLIDPVYQKFTKSVIRALGTTEFYDFFMDSISRAENEFQFSNRKLVKTVDLDWVDAVEDTLEAAMTRARTVAAPMNKQRFPNATPCEVTGTCADCKAEGCICNQIVITRHCRPAGRIKFILVGEDLGM